MNPDRDFATMQDFIVGRLSDDEHRAFEDRLVRDPELARELEQSLRMREGFQQLRTQGYFTDAPARGRSSRIWAPLLVAAAAAGIVIFLGLLRVTEPSPILMAALESRTAADVAPSVAAHFTFVSMRGNSVPDLNLPSQGMIEFRAGPSTRETPHRYRVTLLRQEEGGPARSVASLAGVALDTDGYVHCYADATRLSEGSYLLRIEPDNNSPGMEELFPFNLRASGSGSAR
jgi:hypothetical protein